MSYLYASSSFALSLRDDILPSTVYPILAKRPVISCEYHKPQPVRMTRARTRKRSATRPLRAAGNTDADLSAFWQTPSKTGISRRTFYHLTSALSGRTPSVTEATLFRGPLERVVRRRSEE